MGSSSRKMPGATSIACKHYLLCRARSGKLGGGLDRLVGAGGHRLLALILGGQRQVDRVRGNQVKEGVDDARVEVAPAASHDLLEGLVQAQRRPVDAAVNHG